MKNKLRKYLSLMLSALLTVSMMLGAAVPALAVEAITYDLNVPGNTDVYDGENTYYAQAGETVTVAFRMKAAEESYTLFSVQNEIEFDMNFFEYVDGSAQRGASGAADVRHDTRVRGQEIVKASVFNETFSSDYLFCTFQLKIKDGITEGTGWVRSSEAIAYETNTARVPITASNLTVIIGDAPEALYEIGFDLGGGKWSADADDRSGKYPANASIPLPTPIREGYTFDGWYLDGIKLTGESFTVTSDATLTAHWLGAYTVTYALNGGSDLPGGNTVGANEGETVTLPTGTTAKRTGYLLSGWLDENNVSHAPGSSYTVQENVTLTAQWTECTHPAASRQVTGSSTAYLHSGLSTHDI